MIGSDRVPAEIWVGFAASRVSGRVSLRRRYVQLFRVEKGVVVGLVADVAGEQWIGTTFFRGRVSGLDQLRSGLRIYRSGRETTTPRTEPRR
ncbi:MAG: PBECR2 nuclease fold domain-containing protein [Rhodospirillales bacterium]